MIWNKDTTEKLVKDGKARITKKRHLLKFLRVAGEDALIALDSPTGVYYAGQEYEEFEKNCNYKWAYTIGAYKLFINKLGEVTSVKRSTLQ